MFEIFGDPRAHFYPLLDKTFTFHLPMSILTEIVSHAGSESSDKVKRLVSVATDVLLPKPQLI